MGLRIGNGELQGRGARDDGRVEARERLTIPRPSPLVPRPLRAFTLVELLVVLAILALLLSIAVPRYFGSLNHSKETVLKENLFQVRQSLDHYFSDTGKYPDKIEDLVTRH